MPEVGEPGWYEVVFTRVAIRARPATNGTAIGVILQGKRVKGTPFTIDDLPWLRLSDDELPEEIAVDRAPDVERWMLIDGSSTSLGVGQLMKRVSDEPKKTTAKAKPKAKTAKGSEPATGPSPVTSRSQCEVMCNKVVVRATSSTSAPILGYYSRGERVHGESMVVAGARWLRVSGDAANRKGFVLIDGAKIGLGLLLKEVASDDKSAASHKMWASIEESDSQAAEEPEDLSKWFHYKNGSAGSFRVVLSHVMVRSKPSVKSSAAGMVKKGDILEGEQRDSWLLLTPGISNEALEKGQGKWVLIDATSLGKGKCLEQCLPDPEIKRIFGCALEVKCPKSAEKKGSRCCLQIKPDDEEDIWEPCNLGTAMLVHELPADRDVRLRLCLVAGASGENVLASSDWVCARTAEFMDTNEACEPVLDMLGRERTYCTQCCCQCYVLDTQTNLNSDLTDARCFRCGCNVSAHADIKDGSRKGKEVMLIDKAISLRMKNIVRRWAEFDIPANQKEWPRIPGNFKEVVAWSDLHSDMGKNMDHLMQLPSCPETVLLVAGDVSTAISSIESSLLILKEKYGAIFYVPGNHDLWVSVKDGLSSLHKFMALLELCEKIGVHTRPAFISDSCAICPLYSWYKDNLIDGFSREMANIPFDIQCMWPWDLTGRGDHHDAQQPEIADFFASLNERRIAIAPAKNGEEGPAVISMSHFVPRQEVYPGPLRLAGVMGCREIEAQVRACGSTCHIFGHSHIAIDKRLHGVRYVQHPLGYPSDYFRKVSPLRVWGTNAVSNDEGVKLQSPAAKHGDRIVGSIAEEIRHCKDRRLGRPPGPYRDLDHNGDLFNRDEEMKLREIIGRDYLDAVQEDDPSPMFRQTSHSKDLEFIVRHLSEQLPDLRVTVENMLTVKDLKEEIMGKVRRGPSSSIILTLDGEVPLNDHVVLNSIEDELENAGGVVILQGISLGPPQPVSVTIEHAAPGKSQQSLVIETVDTASILDVRQAIMQKTGEKKLENCKIVRETPDGLIGLTDVDNLNGRTKLLFIGCDLLPKPEKKEVTEKKPAKQAQKAEASHDASKNQGALAPPEPVPHSSLGNGEERSKVEKRKAISFIIGEDFKLKFPLKSSKKNTVLDLKKAICKEVNRGPPSALQLHRGQRKLDDDFDISEFKELHEARRGENVEVKLISSGVDLGPPKEVEVLIRQAVAETPQEIRLRVLDTVTLMEVKSAIASAIGEKSVSQVKLVKRMVENEGFMGLGDKEALGKRRELSMLGCDLPPPSGEVIDCVPSEYKKSANLSKVEAASVQEDAPKYRLRWAVNIDEWQPDGDDQGEEFQFALGLIEPESERNAVMKYRLYEDKKRALISRLMMRASSAHVMDKASFADIMVKRTKGKKPFLSAPLPPEDKAPNWNVNPSHEGSWVVCASEPFCVCGIDVAELRRTTKNGEAIDFYKSYRDQLTEVEWKDVRSCGGSMKGGSLDDQYEVFSRYWSAKEAFTKARGDGLGFPFNRVEFSWSPLHGYPPKTAYRGSVKVDGKENDLWTLIQHKLPTSIPHWVTVARGPLTEIIDAHGEFTQTLRKKQAAFSTGVWKSILEAESPNFKVLRFAQLVPRDELGNYETAKTRAKAAANEADNFPAMVSDAGGGLSAEPIMDFMLPSAGDSEEGIFTEAAFDNAEVSSDALVNQQDEEQGEVEVVVWIEKELELKEVFKVQAGSAVSSLKYMIAEAIVTGEFDIAEIGLKLSGDPGERVLLDDERVTTAFTEVELFTP